MKRKIVFENGREFVGEAFGAVNDVVSEVVFNTNMVGYQEILSDPAYTDLSIVMTYPLIGNYGIIDEDFDSKLMGVKALITSEYNDKPSNFRYANTLAETLEENNVAGITHVDTRAITRMLAREGVMKAAICDEKTSKATALKRIKTYKAAKDQIKRVTCKKVWYSRCSNPKFNVVAIDMGITSHNLVDLNKNGINVTVVPYDTDIKKITALRPDGIFLSKGPGNPKNAKHAIELVKKLQGKYPIFGISLGLEIIALANGLECKKMKVGHRGSNHSIRDEKTGKLFVVNQNHGFCVKDFKKKGIEVTCRDVMDNTIEGLDIPAKRSFGVQYYPNSVVNPEDSKAVIDKFIGYMKKKGGRNA